MSKKFQAEQILEDYQRGTIDEYDAKSSLRRLYGNCSCMSRSIEKNVRDMDYGRDIYDTTSSLERAKRNCDIDDRDRY